MSISIVWSNTGDEVPHLELQTNSDIPRRYWGNNITIGFKAVANAVGQDETVVLRVVP